MITIAMLSLAFNLLLTGLFIVLVKKLLNSVKIEINTSRKGDLSGYEPKISRGAHKIPILGDLCHHYQRRAA